MKYLSKEYLNLKLPQYLLNLFNNKYTLHAVFKIECLIK